jgi:urea transport system ATP-binding protein
VTDPKLLILDEPTEGIQPNIVREIGDIILRLNRGEQPTHPDAQVIVEIVNVIRHLNQEEKLTVLLVEQKLPFARRLADSFAIMEKGAIVASGAISELTDDIVRKHLSV